MNRFSYLIAALVILAVCLLTGIFIRATVLQADKDIQKEYESIIRYRDSILNR